MSLRQLITHADESRGSKGFIRVCTCVCVYDVCLHDRTNTAENTITKLATEVVYHEFWLYI